MQHPQDVEQVLTVMAEELHALKVPFMYCGINLMDESAEPPAILCYSFNGEKQWYQTRFDGPDTEPLRRIWRSQQPTYRPDLQREDPYGERPNLRVPLRAVLDIPFESGTLALSSEEPEVFSPEDVELLQGMAQILADGFRRLPDLERLARQIHTLEAEVAQRRRAETALREEQERLRSCLLQIEEAEQVQRRHAATERVYRRILEMEQMEDFDQVVVLIAGQLRDLGIRFDAVGVNVIDEEAGTICGYDLLADAGGELLRTVDAIDAQSLTAELVARWRRREVWERAGDPAFEESMRTAFERTSKVSPHYAPAVVIDVPFVQGTLAVGLQSTLGSNGPLIQILQEFCTLLSLGFRRSRDLEARRRLEEQLLHAQKLEAVGQLTAGIAHNFNNMLQAIMGNLSLALNEVPQAQRPFLQEALTSSERAAAMIRQLVLFARKGGAAVRRPVDLLSAVEQVASICRRTFDHRIYLWLQLPPGPLTVQGDAGQLEQALLNLCLNARDAMEGMDRPARLELLVDELAAASASPPPHLYSLPQSYARIRVMDNGSGMDEAVRERIFEPFFTTKSVDKGTGLGLSTAYAILRDHQGWIECESRPGAGTTFALYLPALHGKLALPRAAPATAAQEHGTETLLLIDDEELVRVTVARLLRRLGYQVLEAASGREGLEIFSRSRGRIALVLLDLSMPEMPGEEVYARLRVLEPALKALVLTGYESAAVAASAGVPVLKKPISSADLARKVRQTLDH
jgi:signal transduction histidine kinase